MARVLDKLSVCEDCVMAVEQGNDVQWARVSAGYADALSAHDTCPDGEDLGFSWASCDGCNSGLGGTRHEVTILGAD